MFVPNLHRAKIVGNAHRPTAISRPFRQRLGRRFHVQVPAGDDGADGFTDHFGPPPTGPGNSAATASPGGS